MEESGEGVEGRGRGDGRGGWSKEGVEGWGGEREEEEESGGR